MYVITHGACISNNKIPNLYEQGVLNNGDEIAVKKLFPIQDLDDKAFDNEFGNLMSVQHTNIVRLLHYCYETTRKHIRQNGKYFLSEVTDRALCFEYMQGGSLSEHISGMVVLYLNSVNYFFSLLSQ